MYTQICVYIYKLVQKWNHHFENFKTNKQNLNEWPKVFETLITCGSEELADDVSGAIVFAQNFKRN